MPRRMRRRSPRSVSVSILWAAGARAVGGCPSYRGGTRPRNRGLARRRRDGDADGPRRGVHPYREPNSSEDAMAVKVGDKVPSVKIKRMTAEGVKDVDTGELFAGKKVVLFALPGAFTPTCSAKHLPGFVEKNADLKKKGVDLVACLSVNDAFVMDAWGKAQNVGDKVAMLADGNGDFTKAMGLEMDGTGFGMGHRSK